MFKFEDHFDAFPVIVCQVSLGKNDSGGDDSWVFFRTARDRLSNEARLISTVQNGVVKVCAYTIPEEVVEHLQVWLESVSKDDLAEYEKKMGGKDYNESKLQAGPMGFLPREFTRTIEVLMDPHRGHRNRYHVQWSRANKEDLAPLSKIVTA